MKNKTLFFERYQMPEEMFEGDNEILRWIEKQYGNVDVVFYHIAQYKGLSEKFIRKNIDKFKFGVNWNYISMKSTLSESFIEEYQDKISWGAICANQVLSEPFIEKWTNNVDWNYISQFQFLSREFVIKHFNKLSMDCLLRNEKLNDELQKELKLICALT